MTTGSGQKKYINEMGEVRSGKDGQGNYIVITQDVTLPKGTKLYMQTVEEILTRLVDKGIITEEKAQERLDKKPDYVLKKVNAVIG